MLKILVRLYLLIIVAYAGALLFIPDSIVGLFHERFMAYNLDQTKGVQSLIVRQFHQAPQQQWPAVERDLANAFAPLEVKLLRMDQADLSADEQARLEHGLYAVRIADWGYYETVLAPLDKDWLVRLHAPPDPLDINVLSWGVTVLIGAAMLGCLLLWVWPHWRDLERLKETARRLGQGQMAERTHISPHSNIGELAGVFDTMASDLERHVNQQRELLNAVSHELRTPLTRLDFGLVLLFDEVPAASRKRLLELVGHVRELDELVLELLSYSRLYNADQARERVEVSLLELVDSVLGSFAEELDSRGIQWEVRAERELPRFVLDPRLTARAVQNLVRNAMRYCDESLLLRLRLEDDGACLLTVEDDGIGIPVEERERIFQPFYRLDRSRDRNTGGFGLGLAISRRAIEGQGGTLTVAQSALGGAQFRIRLPAGG
ncbi:MULTISPECIES: ATP-binding protein [unclassified Pseudomonas]|uniref:ATP-binding protein n=1 Tax=unclassified Pseudomonas TaxID=196821 RepID=UPI0004142307|nr:MULTISPECIES: ATP-binding protein [unclassified Pseudomonas]SMF35216.1 two-component system, OmpR family, sensor kinase [Pseudomonas sp. LAIL14HWK12:I11]SMR79059.1 two-component system, OmpR family, sensor kinase [Pseudomonas sp. LAIL14HWK12:I10]SOD04817.1 two-component system, OmpR family, sensor kinase [Pseudomonas sp. LAIL14HWK12:I8]